MDIPGGGGVRSRGDAVAGWQENRAAATWLGVTVLFVVLVVYVPIEVVERGSLDSLNYLGDTLMYCGAVLLLAGAMPAKS